MRRRNQTQCLAPPAPDALKNHPERQNPTRAPSIYLERNGALMPATPKSSSVGSGCFAVGKQKDLKTLSQIPPAGTRERTQVMSCIHIKPEAAGIASQWKRNDGEHHMQHPRERGGFPLRQEMLPVMVPSAVPLEECVFPFPWLLICLLW